MKSLPVVGKRVISSPYLAVLLRWYIGAVFIYASLSKIHYPAEFAESIAAYQIIPYWAINFAAVLLPSLELVTGLFLLIGLRTRAAAAIIGGLLVVFIIALLLSIYRDLPISCGCFSSAEDQIGLREVGRDIMWLVFVVQIFFFDKIFQLKVEGILRPLNSRFQG
jgi:putative oxidoreductase